MSAKGSVSDRHWIVTVECGCDIRFIGTSPKKGEQIYCRRHQSRYQTVTGRLPVSVKTATSMH